MFSVDRVFAAAVQALLPQRCHWCSGASATATCEGCARRLPWDDRSEAGTWAAFRYESTIAAQIVSLKFHARFAPAHLLGALMAGRLAQRAEPLPELLVPVPLHPQRLRHRGYNQALEIAREISARLSIPLAPGAARRRRHTGEQTRLDAAQRRRNVHGAFEVSEAVVRARHVAVLDDVVTTGATSGELVRAIERAGARRVEVWAAARAELAGGKIHGETREHRKA